MSSTRTTRSRRDGPAGMTLIELLVAVAILTIMILLFASILTDSQQIVSQSQAAMQANTKAAAIAEIIRTDISRITQNGFLILEQVANGSPPLLAFTVAGTSPSTETNIVGTGMVVCYGITENSASGATDKILRRRAWVLDPEQTATSEDVIDMDLTDVLLGSLKLPTVDGLVTSPAIDDPSQAVSVSADIDRGQMDNLWQCLTDKCKSLSIMWTNGDKEPGTDDLAWYGIIAREDAYDLRPEGTEADTGIYLGLWNRYDQNTWPKAIRFRFTLVDEDFSMPDELADSGLAQTAMPGKPNEKVYEVICPIAN